MDDAGAGFVPLDTNYLQAIEKSLEPQVKKKKKLSKAEKQERKRLAEIEFKKQEMYTSLAREVELSRKNYLRQQVQWEELCCGLKFKELKEELAEWTDKTERWFKEKDDKIDLLINELQESVWLNKRANSSREGLFAFLKDVHTALLDASQLNYEVNVDKLLNEYLEDKNYYQTYGQAILEQSFTRLYAQMVYSAHLLEQEEEVDVDHKMALINYEIKRRYDRREEILKRMTTMNDKLCDFVAVISDTTLDEEKYKRLNTLMEEAELLTNEAIELKAEGIEGVIYIDELNREYQILLIKIHKKLSDLEYHFNYFKRLERNIRITIRLERYDTDHKSRLLGKASYRVITDLRRRLVYGNSVLTLVANCRKMETQAQKVVSYGDLSLRYDDITEDDLWLHSVDLTKYLGLKKEKLASDLYRRSSLMRRMAMAAAQAAVIRKYKEKLMAERDELIQLVKVETKTEDPVPLTTTLHVVQLQAPPEAVCQKYRLKHPSLSKKKKKKKKKSPEKKPEN